ncbi:MAG: ATP-binding cassette domain-containing protein [Actinobacteria bacterium]|nr:ATP-binding cassette domain-containing protein [Actinomycetota bacterium]
MQFELFGLEISAAVLALGAITGMTYGILAVGLVLVYRSNKVLNFAHGEIGAIGAAVCGILVVRSGLPFWVAFAIGVSVSAGAGALTEVAVIRRLRNAPKLMSLVATLGVAQFLLAFSAVVNSQARSGSTFPQPAGLPEFRIGVLLVTRAYSAMLFISPMIVLALVLFLRRSRYGIAMRAASANTERARMAGISAGRMSTIAWTIAGAVAAFTTILIIPTRGFITAETLGPVLLLRALAPAVIARMTSLPIALGAGVAIGIVDQVLVYNYPTSGISEMILLGTIVVTLLFQARPGGRVEDKQDWAALQPWPVLAEEFRQVWAIRNLGRMTGAVALAVAVWVGAASSNSTAVTLVAIAAFALIGLSIGIITGLGGQLALGQFALAGVGATVSHLVARELDNVVLGLLVAGAVTGLVSVVLGLPALRVRGLLLAVVTLSFALAAQRWLLSQSWMLGPGASSSRPTLGTFSFDATDRYYFWALGVLVLGYWLSRNVWQGGVGLRLRAVRDNEDAARAFGISATATKLHGFAIAGVIVGCAGSVYGHLLSRISFQSFDVMTSINVVALTVLGGIGLLAGPILGAFYIIGLPRFFPLDNAGLAASALGWLLLILYFPGGIAQLVAGPRRRIIHRLARRHGLDPEAIEGGERGVAAATGIGSHRVTLDSHKEVSVTDEALLEGIGLSKRFGGIRAVDGVDLVLARGEILGLIGPNGAGKTTLFELLSGFTAPDEGRVRFVGRDVTGASPEERARLGLIRSFQDAALFPTLTVLETVALSFERRQPTNVVASSLGMHAQERSKEAIARELVALMGLDRHRHKQIRELSTGTRRITELACVVALEPVVLLLDEPSSGIAQRESEALGELLLSLRSHLDCTMVVIEHDIPLLMGLSTRVIAMDTGRVIAAGSPAEVRNDPVVVTSYLGGDLAAIERSGAIHLDAAADAAPEQCRATTRAGHRCTRLAGAEGVCTIHRKHVEVSS